MSTEDSTGDDVSVKLPGHSSPFKRADEVTDWQGCSEVSVNKTRKAVGTEKDHQSQAIVSSGSRRGYSTLLDLMLNIIMVWPFDRLEYCGKASHGCALLFPVITRLMSIKLQG